MLRRIFLYKIEKAAEGWKQYHKEGLCNLYS